MLVCKFNVDSRLSLHPTHITTKEMLFYVDGAPVKIAVGTKIKIFPSIHGAISAVAHAGKLDANAKWAIKKLEDKHLLLVWIEGDIRGIPPNKVQYL